MNNRMDPLVNFCLPLDLKSWINDYRAPSTEGALVKQVPLNEFNNSMIDRLSRIVPIVRRYRGPRSGYKTNSSRDCKKQYAERVSIYLKGKAA